MKPIIYYRNFIWLCEDDIACGCGDSPKDAYKNWSTKYILCNKH